MVNTRSFSLTSVGHDDLVVVTGASMVTCDHTYHPVKAAVPSWASTVSASRQLIPNSFNDRQAGFFLFVG